MCNTHPVPSRGRGLAGQPSRTLQAIQQVRAYTLNQLEERFGACVPSHLFPKAPKKANSRDRHYTRWRTFWCALWQNLHPEATCKEVAQQLKALFCLQGGPKISANNGAYCRARARLPLDQFPLALSATAQAADQRATSTAFLRGRPVKVADGSTVTVADTPKNRKAYPALQCPGVTGFPMLRLVVLFSLLSGAIPAVAQGSLACSELSLLNLLLSSAAPGDILLGDGAYGCFGLIALLQQSLSGVDFIGRAHRPVDGRRRLKRLARNDWLIQWEKSVKRSPWISRLQWAALPKTLTLRAVKGSLYQKGFRVRQVTVVTTLLDAKLYPAQEILQAYRRRWRLEICLDDLKTTLGMEMLHNRSPQMVQQELYARLIAHNLVRCVMAEAAAVHQVPLTRISFSGALSGVRQFSQALAQAPSDQKRQELWDELLHALASDLVPERPGRREPRAVKRKKNRYPRLNVPRHRFRDHLKRHDRRKLSQLRKLGAM